MKNKTHLIKIHYYDRDQNDDVSITQVDIPNIPSKIFLLNFLNMKTKEATKVVTLHVNIVAIKACIIVDKLKKIINHRSPIYNLLKKTISNITNYFKISPVE